MNDGPIDSLTPKIAYSVSGSMVTLRLRLEQAGKPVREERLNLSTANKNALAKVVAAQFVSMATQIPLTGNIQ